jgi:hypothetical protein
MGNEKDFGRPSKEAMALALSFVKQTVLPRILADIRKNEEIQKNKEKQH